MDDFNYDVLSFHFLMFCGMTFNCTFFVPCTAFDTKKPSNFDKAWSFHSVVGDFKLPAAFTLQVIKQPVYDFLHLNGSNFISILNSTF